MKTTRVPVTYTAVPHDTRLVAAVRARRDGDAEDAPPAALQRAASLLGWAGAGAFGRVIPDGARVVVKPNWVMHANQGPWGVEPLYTDPTLVKAVVEEVLCARPSRVILGDAPLQSCDFGRLVADGAIDHWARALAASDPRFIGPCDFRRTRCRFVGGIRQPEEDQLPLDRFVLFDLGAESLLEPVSDGRGSFRVTQYDPARMQDAHSRGRHRYLVARDIIEADVVVNLPKLKTHKKAGVTCALKNLIGINGNKEFLPHHRVGGADAGGDCYPGRSPIKRSLEFALDRLNGARGGAGRRVWHFAKRVLDWATASAGDELGVEGSWHGNDTIWRTCLDLNRILLYGRPDGTMAERPQRRVLHVVDAMVAGQGDGPLSPEPFPLDLLLAGESSAAVDLVGATLLGYEPSRIPLVREAFGRFRWPLVTGASDGVRLTGDLGDLDGAGLMASARSRPERYPAGWLDAVDVRAGAVTTI